MPDAFGRFATLIASNQGHPTGACPLESRAAFLCDAGESMKILILLTIIGVMVPLLGLEFQALDSLRAFFYLWTPLLLAWVIVIFYQVFKLLMHGLNRLHEKRRPN